MSKDASRYNLVINFTCAQCGTKLALSYDNPKVSQEYAPEKNDGITGADKVVATIAVHPCKKCYDEAIEPIEALRKVMKSIDKAKATK